MFFLGIELGIAQGIQWNFLYHCKKAAHIVLLK